MKKRRIIALILATLCCFMIGCDSNIKTETQPATQVKREKNIEYLYDENTDTLTISGEVKITDDSVDSLNFVGVMRNLVITGDVEKIGKNAFLSCESLEEVKFSKNIKIIDDGAFYWCKNLSKVSIPEGVEKVGVHAFASCDLEEITIPKSVTSIGREAFGFYADPDNWYSEPIEDFTIKGYKGSTAEKYAKENGFNFVALDE